jgi:peptide/nickel transport system substrate-binding protein
MRRLWLLAFGATLLASTAVSAETLRIGLNEDPDMLDPDRARTFVGRVVFTSLCEKLVDINEKLEFVPRLATEWEWGEDVKSLTFRLREGVTFHDGTPFNAEAVKFNIERSKTLEGSLRKSELASVERVEVIDDKTVRLVFNKPDATVLAQLADRSGMMISTKADENFAQAPVCSGPYKFVNRVQNDRIVLQKFPEHWEANDYHFDELIFMPIPDTTVRLANLQSGDLDLIERLAATDIPTVEGDANLAVQQVVSIGYQGITFNIANGDRAKNPLAQDKRVRQAFELAIDRKAINDVVFAGTHPPAWQAHPPASPYFNKELPEPTRDVEKAKQLLKEAGAETVQVELSHANNNINRQVNEVIQSMVSEAGFQVTLAPAEFAAMLDQNQAGNFQASQFGWSGRADPDGNIYSQVTCEGGLNDGRYCNKEVDRILTEARQTTDVEARKALYAKADQMLKDELPIIYLYYQPWIYAHQKAVTGFKAYPDGMMRLKGVKIER